MSAIDKLTGTPRTTAVRRAAGPAASHIAWTPAAAEEASAVPPTVALAALDGLLALQEFHGDAAQDRHARRHGQAMLGQLAVLQAALLHPDGAAPATLARLASLSDAMPPAASPKLQSVLQSIALRARLELARHDRPV